MNQTWYQKQGSAWADFWTMLHLPYTLMCISFLVIGFGIERVSRWDIFILTVIAYFLGLGIASHSFDQLSGMGSSYVQHISQKNLMLIGMVSVTTAVFIGVNIMFHLKAWNILWMIPIQTFFVWAYPVSKFMKGVFHSDFWFAVSFGFIPVMVGYYINTLTLNPIFIGWAVVAFIISLIEITLSRYVRAIRRTTNPLNEYYLRPEKALKLLCLLSYLIALTLILGGK